MRARVGDWVCIGCCVCDVETTKYEWKWMGNEKCDARRKDQVGNRRKRTMTHGF